uniref:Replication-associated protein ORF2/G2P domain-containing protein n=1 Tax=Chlamydiamicrovirus sp. TaxID=2832664 RepID=A0AB39A395_9VIRU
MPCYHPIRAYRSKEGRNKNGKWPIVFSRSQGYQDLPVEIPCGRCIGCRLEKSRQWAIRCVHESKLHVHNCFLTLTYDDDHIDDNSLNPDHITKFLKRLRSRHNDKKIRYFQCGEYGDNFGRRHHHCVLFGFDFSDKIPYCRTKSGEILYNSDELSKLWPYGYATIGNVTFESCAYVARYITKKILGPDAEKWYEQRKKHPEYCTMSRRPGIGYEYYKKYGKDWYVRDQIIIRDNLTCKPAKYYDYIYDMENPSGKRRIDGKRKKAAKLAEAENSPDRLAAKEQSQYLKQREKNRRKQYGY